MTLERSKVPDVKVSRCIRVYTCIFYIASQLYHIWLLGKSTLYFTNCAYVTQRTFPFNPIPGIFNHVFKFSKITSRSTFRG